MTLAIFLNHRFYKVNGQYYCDLPNLLDLFSALKRQTGALVLCAPTIACEEPPRWVQPLIGEFEVHELPFYRSHTDLLRRLPQLVPLFFRTILPSIRSWDIVGGVAPSGFGLAAVLMARILRRRTFVLVRGNVTSSLRNEYKMAPVKKALVLAAIWPLDLLTRVLVRSGLTAFTFGPLLATIYRGPNTHVLHGTPRSVVVQSGSEPVSDPALLTRLLYVGRLTGEKGADVLLRAVASVRERGYDVQLTIVGDGAERSRLENLRDELGLGGKVTFNQYVKDPVDLRAVYLGHGVVVLPSRTEGVPNVLLEAMALGRVVIATKVGGIPSSMTDEKEGLLVPPEDPEALAQAIERVQTDPTNALRMARGAIVASLQRNVDREAKMMLESMDK